MATYNESSLHEQLKSFYLIQTEGKAEVYQDNHIYDVISKDGIIIEIQTKNISKLKNKISDVLNKNKKIKIVTPVITRKTIITTDETGNQISKKTSPKKETIYDTLKELTGIYKYLLNTNFSIDFVFITLIEHRVKTTEKVQSKNKKRRFKRDWIKVNKSLEEIIKIKTFKTKSDYLTLLPLDLPQNFSSREVKDLLQNQQKLPKRNINNVSLILWLLKRMEIIEEINKKGNLKIYNIKTS